MGLLTAPPPHVRQEPKPLGAEDPCLATRRVPNTALLPQHKTCAVRERL